MTEDFFALLGEPRRPWLDPERSRKRSTASAARNTPTSRAGRSRRRFRAAQPGAGNLARPKARLRHLLELEYPEIKLSGPSNVPPGLADWFVSVHGLLGETDGVLTKKAAASTALAKALLARVELATREKVESVLAQLDALHATATEELIAFDILWIGVRPPDAAATLQGFYQRFAYLSRWIEQLRERLFQLGT